VAPKLPKQLTLPSGTVVQLRRGETLDDRPLAPNPDAPLFDETITALAEGRVLVTKGGARVDHRTLVLRDFHVLRAVLARSGVVAEEEVEIRCRNCEAPIRIRPCAALEIGPWAFGELDDPELDVTLPFGEPIDVPPLPLGRVRTAKSVTFEDRTVQDAMPLFAAAVMKDVGIDVSFVRALGIVALGAERDPTRIAAALATCDDAAFAAVADAFLGTHYVPRLGCVAFCKGCGARNDVDAPYERELVPGGGASGAPLPAPAATPGGAGERAGFPDFAAFATRAREIARPLLDEAPDDHVELVIEDGTPAVDDGGEPLLGSYVPPHPGDATMPSRSPSVSVYYRTFRAVWDEEGPYDWEDELTETIEHELEHHMYFLRGEDPMDDEERETIREEALRIVGRREAGRRELVGFGASLRDFAVRTWPLWVIAFLALAFTLATQR
jgi:hypothetical protein